MARYTYTPGGRLATIESGNGIITRYTYDGEGNLSGLSVQKGAGERRKRKRPSTTMTC